MSEALDRGNLTLDVESIDWWPHQEFCRIMGKHKEWARGKIKLGKWKEGEQYVYDPDGQIWVSIKGFKKWLTSNIRPAPNRTALASGSDSHGTANGMSQSGRASQTKQTSLQQVVYELK